MSCKNKILTLKGKNANIIKTKTADNNALKQFISKNGMEQDILHNRSLTDRIGELEAVYLAETTAKNIRKGKTKTISCDKVQRKN
jgi:predicted DNA-binding protein